MLDYRVNTGRRLDYHYLVNATMLYENLRGFMLLRLIGTMQLLMDVILELTKRHDISLVEDCFRVYGATYKGEKQALLVILVASACN